MKKVPTGLGLKQGETILWYGNRSWRSYSFWILFILLWVFLGLAFPILLLMGIALGIFVVINRFNSEYAVTNKRAFSRYGFSLGEGSSEIPLDDIHEVELKRTIIGESMNYGDIEINRLGGTEVVFKGVYDPEKIVDSLKSKIS